MGAPAAASSRTRGKTIFPAGSPGTGRRLRAAGPRSPARGAGMRFFASRSSARSASVRPARLPSSNVSGLQPVVQAAFGDPEVLGDLVQRSLALAGDCHDVVAELLGIGLGHDRHPSSEDESSQVRCQPNSGQSQPTRLKPSPRHTCPVRSRRAAMNRRRVASPPSRGATRCDSLVHGTSRATEPAGPKNVPTSAPTSRHVAASRGPALATRVAMVCTLGSVASTAYVDSYAKSLRVALSPSST